MQKEYNLYDNQEFFDGYKKLRSNKMSANNVEEKPALFALMPPLDGKCILDLGCGYGENCKTFSEMGAKSVLGIDISEKMLSVAKQQNSLSNGRFKRLNMNNLAELDEKFDVVVSSLAFHYIEDFDALICSIKNLMNDGGILLFTQEHPIATAPKSGIKWKTNGDFVEGMMLTDYSNEGVRDVEWIVNHVIKYHRKTSTIINTIINQGFVIIEIDEPCVSNEIIQREHCLSRCLHSPDYLIVKAKLSN